jgi:glycosyltransferase involved in cell wall biosynthesis
VVVDTGSKDRTIEIARSFSANVLYAFHKRAAPSGANRVDLTG